ncbi:hypothetical protein Cob_v009315 [Colletotrichum orbiculare MAFF 240422]|uniref:Uncharacterized protein n=1 Tax=Colletotrichum orbiculare (strain 104-T / ATCC 96160 / CBS 514.97 / LARS 414 / MAFF 240422) TaxID=1213857 RepID=A0A484FH12_COLOR|nr:hypothetical protein Cob_v009315 [Colletotrichum orbiculare MAFF 240422]
MEDHGPQPAELIWTPRRIDGDGFEVVLTWIVIAHRVGSAANKTSLFDPRLYVVMCPGSVGSNTAWNGYRTSKRISGIFSRT